MQTIKLDDVEYIRKDSIQEIPEVEGGYVIVRCRNAGVHSGYLESKDGNFVVLKKSRRLWRWWSKFTLSGLAMSGVLKGKESEVRFSCVVPEIMLVTSDVCEIIPCTHDARISIQSIVEHKNE